MPNTRINSDSKTRTHTISVTVKEDSQGRPLFESTVIVPFLPDYVDKEDWHIEHVLYEKRKEKLAEQVSTAYFYIFDKEHVRVAIYVFNLLIEKYSFPMNLKIHQQPGVNIFMIDYVNHLLSADDVTEFICTVQKSLSTLVTEKVVNKDQGEEETEVDEEVVSYEMPFSNNAHSEEFVEDEFSLGVVEDD